MYKDGDATDRELTEDHCNTSSVGALGDTSQICGGESALSVFVNVG